MPIEGLAENRSCRGRGVGATGHERTTGNPAPCRMKIVLTVVLLFACTKAFALTPYKQLPSGDELRAAIDREGARTVFWSGLWRDDSGAVFNAFVEKVASGEVQWLDLATRLRPASDAGASEGLDGAVSGALPRNPTAVLALSSLADSPGQFSIASVCSGRFYLWAEEPAEKARQWYVDAERAVSKVTAQGLSAKRSACLTVIAISSRRFEEHQGKDETLVNSGKAE